MVIVFYAKEEEKFYIASDKMHVVNADDPKLIDYLPDEDVLYVTHGHYFSKEQFLNWLSGKLEVEENLPTEVEEPIDKNRKYIHPTSNGTVLIEDIDTPKFPGGVVLSGRWDFVSVDEIGKEVLASSRFFRLLLQKKKIEVVDEEYVRKNRHKATGKSPAERALDRILIKDDRPGTAGKVATGGIKGDLSDDDGAVSILIES